MNHTTIALLLLGGVAFLSLLAVINHRLESMRRLRLRRLAEAQKSLQRSWAILDQVPSAYLLPALKQVLVRIIAAQLVDARQVDANSPDFEAQASRLEQLKATLADPNAAAASDHISQATPSAEQRQTISILLRDLRRLATEMAGKQVLSHQAARSVAELCDTTLARVVLDHYKANAKSAEQLGRRKEAMGYLAKARESLEHSGSGAFVSNERAAIDADLARLQQLLDAAAAAEAEAEAMAEEKDLEGLFGNNRGPDAPHQRHSA